MQQSAFVNFDGTVDKGFSVESVKEMQRLEESTGKLYGLDDDCTSRTNKHQTR